MELNSDEGWVKVMNHDYHQFTSDWGHDLAHFRELGDILGKRWFRSEIGQYYFVRKLIFSRNR